MEERVTITKRTHRMLSAKVKFNQIREDLLEYGEKELDKHSYEGLDTGHRIFLWTSPDNH